MGTDLSELSRNFREISRNNGWTPLTVSDWYDSDYRIPTCLALIHSEVSEALDAFREKDKSGFREEIADILIRVIEAFGTWIDLDEEIKLKTKKNRKRTYKHGGKRI